jgi:hypothetical protein
MLQFLYNKKNINTINNIFETKSFVFNYPKFFIRNSFNNIDFVLDNSLEISTCIKDAKINPAGYSIALNKTLYTHKLYKNLKFYWFNPNLYLQQKLEHYLNLVNLKHFIFFVKISKGGVESYSSGFRGILPKAQFLFMAKLPRTSLLTSKLNFFVTLKRSSKFIFFKAPVEVARITAYPTHSSSLSINSTPNTLNVIFNYSNKLTTHENKKTHKKNHKPNSKKKH